MKHSFLHGNKLCSMNQKALLMIRIFGIPLKMSLYPSDYNLEDRILIKNSHIESTINYLNEDGNVVNNKSIKEVNLKSVVIGIPRAKIGALGSLESVYNFADSSLRSLNPFEYSTHSNPFHKISSNIEFACKTLNNFNKTNYRKLEAEKGNSWIVDSDSNIIDKSQPDHSNKRCLLSNTAVWNPKDKPFSAKKVKEIALILSNNRNEDSYYSTSRFNLYVLKLLNSRLKDVHLKLIYSEGAHPPFIVQMFLHLPLFMTSVLIVIIIVTFDSDIDKNMILKEISKLPSQEFTPDLPYCECSICLDKFQPKNSIRILSCNHCFHKECIDQWLINLLKCPLCRTSISKLPDTQAYQLYQTLNYM